MIRYIVAALVIYSYSVSCTKKPFSREGLVVTRESSYYFVSSASITSSPSTDDSSSTILAGFSSEALFSA